MPKSGTTAILRLMALASGEQACNDPLHELDRKDLSLRTHLFEGKVRLPELMNRYRRLFRGSLIKDPNFVYFHEELAERWPSASWVFTVRDPRDNIRSILNRLRLPGTNVAIEAAKPGIHGNWADVLAGRNPELAGRNPIERMAYRWVRNAEIIAGLAGVGIVSRYEDFERDKEGTIAQLCRTAGLTPNFTLGTATDQQFQPRGNREVSWYEFFGHEELKTIDGVCSSWLAHFGYPLSSAP